MKNTRFKFEYRKSASKLHKCVGDILRSSPIFSNYEIYQEYPVNRINPSYQNTRHKFDWAIPKLDLVIECHGKQHYELVNFGGKTPEEAISDFNDLRKRDKLKEEAALDMGFRYVVVPYSMEKEIDEQKLLELVNKSNAVLQEYIKQEKKNEKPSTKMDEQINRNKEFKRSQYRAYKESYGYKEQLDRAREARRERYRVLKQQRDQ